MSSVPSSPHVTLRRGADAPTVAPLVLVAGNPNSGKSTVFNALTGARAKVANYPGVTVDRKSARLPLPSGSVVELVDLPGTYSLSARSGEEQVAVDALLGRLGRPPDAVVVVADATALARALYLVLEVAETGVPMIVALTMMDEARAKSITIDLDRLASLLGVPVVPLEASKGRGVGELTAVVERTVAAPHHPPGEPAAPVSLLPEFPAPLEDDVRELEAAVLASTALPVRRAARSWAQWVLLSVGDEATDTLRDIPSSIRALAARIRRRAETAGRNLDLEIISERYRHVDRIVDATITLPAVGRRSWTDRLDAVLTHRVWGAMAFVAVMVVVFQALFSWSEPAIASIERLVATLQDGVRQVAPAGPLSDLLVDGVIAGVGIVIAFVPQIALLFFFIGLLEDVGYLARVAFVIDRLMGSIGLHGRAFVPMLSGFSCAVPAVLATRTMENRTDRLLTMMVLPLMSCSARLPIYLLVSATVFDSSLTVLGWLSAGAIALFGMYALSVCATLLAAAVLRRTVFKGPGSTLVLELPPYRRPVLSVLLVGVWQRVRTFLRDAGTIILALTIVLWALLSYPRDASVRSRFDALRAAANTTAPAASAPDETLKALDSQERGEHLRHSFAGRLGRWIEPALTPLGLDWRIGIGILGAFAAREVFVSTLGIVFDISEADETTPSLREALRTATKPDGSKLMTPLAGVSLMVFFVLACQCMSTIAVVRRESGSWTWPAAMFVYMTGLAYVASLTVYQVGRALQWGLA
ncbi:MAG: ferrous iron transport protein B [Vicinamibacterales bacterium]